MNGLDDLLDITSELPDWLQKAIAVPRQEGYVTVDGCNIHYFSWGKPGATGLLMTHGRMSHARCWTFVAPLLAERFYCVAFDLSGMGESGHRDYYSYQNRVNETFAVAEAASMFENGANPFLVSHSYGGVVMSRAVERDPESWAGMIACEPSMPHPDNIEGRLPRRDHQKTDGVRKRLVYPDLETAMGRFRISPPQPCKNDFLMEYLARHSLKLVKDGWTWKFDPAVYSIMEEGHNDWWVDATERFLDLKIPKSLIYAGDSSFVGHKCAEYIYEHQVPVMCIDQAHHHLMLDRPHALATAINAHVDELGQVDIEVNPKKYIE